MKKVLSIIIPAVFMVIAIFSSCTKKNAEDLTLAALNDTISNDTISLCEPEGLYATEVKPIMDAYCTTCHAPGGLQSSMPLNTYSNLALISSEMLLGTINHEAGFSAMPDGGAKLTDCEILTVQKWVDGGMLDN